MKTIKGVVCGLALVAGCFDAGKLGATDELLTGSGGSGIGVDAGTGSGSGSTAVFHSVWSGRSANVNGAGQVLLWLQASENTSGATRNATLSFQLAGPDPSNGQNIMVVSGFGSIPSSAFQVTADAARLQLTTDASFTITTCTFPWWAWWEMTCGPGGSESFDLTWTANHLSSSSYDGVSRQTSGAYSTETRGAFSDVSADVTGTAGGLTFSGPYGDIADTRGGIVTRDVYPSH